VSAAAGEREAHMATVARGERDGLRVERDGLAGELTREAAWRSLAEVRAAAAEREAGEARERAGELEREVEEARMGWGGSERFGRMAEAEMRTASSEVAEMRARLEAAEVREARARAEFAGKEAELSERCILLMKEGKELRRVADHGV